MTPVLDARVWPERVVLKEEVMFPIGFREPESVIDPVPLWSEVVEG